MPKRFSCRWMSVSSVSVLLLSASAFAQSSEAHDSASSQTAASAAWQTPLEHPSRSQLAQAQGLTQEGKQRMRQKDWNGAKSKLEPAYQLAGQASVLQALAQCEQESNHFTRAQELYELLLSRHGTQMKPREKEDIYQALQELRFGIGTVEIKVREPGAQVFLDDKLVGSAPLAKPLRLDVGTYRLRVTQASFSPFEQSITVPSDDKLVVEPRLEPLLRQGQVRIREAKGSAVHVWLDQKDVGLAPWTGQLKEGTHTVRLQGEKLQSHEQSFEVLNQGTTELILQSEPQVSSVQLVAHPKTAQLLVNGKPVGQGRWQSELAPGTYQLEVRALGFTPTRQTLQVRPGQRLHHEVSLESITPASPAPVETHPYRGFVANFGLFGAMAQHSGQPIGDSDSGSSQRSNLKPIAAGAVLRAGHSWGLWSLDFTGAFLSDIRAENQTYAETDATKIDTCLSGSGASSSTAANSCVPHTESYLFYNFGGFAGVGGHLSTKTEAVRFTGGLSVGGVYRSLHMRRELNGAISESLSTAQSYLAPGLFIDAGVLFGSTPGTKLYLGAIAWLDFPGSDITAAGRTTSYQSYGLSAGTTTKQYAVPVNTPAYTLAKGPQFFIGPTLGVQFGR